MHQIKPEKKKMPQLRGEFSANSISVFHVRHVEARLFYWDSNKTKNNMLELSHIKGKRKKKGTEKTIYFLCECRHLPENAVK